MPLQLKIIKLNHGDHITGDWGLPGISGKHNLVGSQVSQNGVDVWLAFLIDPARGATAPRKVRASGKESMYDSFTFAAVLRWLGELPVESRVLDDIQRELEERWAREGANAPKASR